MLDELLGDWRPLLERFAADRAPMHFRPRGDTGAVLRRLQAAGVRIGVFTDAPRELAELALAHVGALRRVEIGRQRSTTCSRRSATEPSSCVLATSSRAYNERRGQISRTAASTSSSSGSTGSATSSRS